MKTILIQNFHPANTIALVKDFKAIGYRVVMPDSNWDGQVGYYFSNEGMGGELISYADFMALPKGDILVACYEQQNDFMRISAEHGDRLLLHTAGNNVPYEHGISQHLLSPDIQTYNNYPARNKMLYWFPPTLAIDVRAMGGYELPNYEEKYKNRMIAAYIHYYAKFWKDSWRNALEFESFWGQKVWMHGHETRDGALTLSDAQLKMRNSFFTLYFKEKDCYGNTVLESMALGTPVIAMRRYIHDKTLGMFFLNDKNSIIVDSPFEAVMALNKLTMDEYVAMAENGIQTVLRLTESEKRLKELSEMLSKE